MTYTSDTRHARRAQKRKDEMCPFLILAFLQPTTVDKEPKKADESFDSSGFFGSLSTVVG